MSFLGRHYPPLLAPLAWLSLRARLLPGAHPGLAKDPPELSLHALPRSGAGPPPPPRAASKRTAAKERGLELRNRPATMPSPPPPRRP